MLRIRSLLTLKVLSKIVADDILFLLFLSPCFSDGDKGTLPSVHPSLHLLHFQQHYHLARVFRNGVPATA